jgi:hypothetical protein
MLQLSWSTMFGLWAAEQLQRLSAGDLGCFYQIGAYRLCDATQRLSIFASFFLLQAQALISRVLVPGMSNFVNASVSKTSC